MKKLAIVLAIAMVLSMFAAVSTSAHIDGVKDRYEYEIPHINAANGEIVFDGIVDLETEWYDALCVTMDVSPDSDNYEETTIWPCGVWGGHTWNPSIFDEISEEFMATYNTYFLWSEEGLYMASTCYDSTGFNGMTTSDFFDYYWTGTIAEEDYSGNLANNVQHEFVMSDNEDNGLGANGKWFYAFPINVPENFNNWGESYTGLDSTSDNEWAKKTISVGHQANSADENGYYPWAIETFIPWGLLVLDNADITVNAYDFKGVAGETFQCGLIYRQRVATSDECPCYCQITNGQGWGNFDFYTLNATPAETSPNAPAEVEEVVEEVEEVELVEVTEEVEVVEEVEEVEEAAPAPTTNPTTADVSVLFYALAAISAVGGLSVFKRK